MTTSPRGSCHRRLTLLPRRPAADLARWADADAAARPGRLERFRARFDAQNVDAYFGVRRENTRYLTGFELGEGEEKSAGHSGQFFVGRDEVVVLADSRYTIQAGEQARGARIADAGYDLPSIWPGIVASLGASRIAVEAGFVSQALWRRLEAALPDVELVPVEGWIEADRATKESAELERVAAACAVADRALAALLPKIQPGVSEASLALDLEWLLRTGGAEAVAFDPTCLAGPRAALPHGSPTTHRFAPVPSCSSISAPRSAGYRSDMTRTLFVGEPTRARPRGLRGRRRLPGRGDRESRGDPGRGARAAFRPRSLRDLLRRDRVRRALAAVRSRAGPRNRPGDTRAALAQSVRVGRAALPSPTVFSVEPGIYIEGEIGVRIEDLVLLDAGAGRLERLTLFPRDVIVVGD